jgi:hypothetical protein
MIGRMLQAETLSLSQVDAPPPSGVATRRARLRALLSDIGTLLGGSLLAVLLAFAYLLVRTNGGATDVGDFDSALAGALLLAIPPTWAARLLISLAENRATPGQRRAGLVIARREDRRPAALLLGMAMHPLSLPLWVWSAVMLLMLSVPVLPWLVALWCALVTIVGLASLVVLIVQPQAPAIHDQLAGTQVVVRS